MNTSVTNGAMRFFVFVGCCSIVSWLQMTRMMAPFSRQLRTLDKNLHYEARPDVSTSDPNHPNHHRSLQHDTAQNFELGYSYVEWHGIDHAEWCQAPIDPPLPYEDCAWGSFVFQFGVHGGLTNALHFILKGKFGRHV